MAVNAKQNGSPVFHAIETFGVAYGDPVTGPEPADDGPILGGWTCELESQALTWTEGVFDIFGLERNRAIDRRETLLFYSDESRELLERRRGAAIAAGKSFSLVASLRRRDGVDRWMRIDAIPHLRNGRVVALHGTKRDVTEERSAWEALRKLAHSDPLTGVSNRTAFQACLLDRPQGSASLADVGALVLFDVDDFKALNDGWGHPAGDACLVTFAQRLLGRFGDAKMVARIGGDEFALLLSREDALRHLSGGLAALMPSLLAPFGWRDGMLSFGVSAGAAFVDGDCPVDPDALYACADADLYRSKANRKNRRERRRPAF